MKEVLRLMTEGASALVGVVLACFVFAEPASAADLTIANLRAVCASRNPIDSHAYQFYIFGVSEGILLGRQTASTPNVFCLPSGLNAEAMSAKVREMMPLLGTKSDDLPAASAVAAVLNNAYPCQK